MTQDARELQGREDTTHNYKGSFQQGALLKEDIFNGEVYNSE